MTIEILIFIIILMKYIKLPVIRCWVYGKYFIYMISKIHSKLVVIVFILDLKHLFSISNSE